MPPDQPRPEMKPTREHRELAARIRYGFSFDVSNLGARYLNTGEVSDATLEYCASILASRDAAAEERGRRLERERLLALQQPWPLLDVLTKLQEAASILLREKDYDGHGWESIDHAIRAADDIIAVLHAFPPISLEPSQPKESATPAAAEVPALELKCSACGGSGESQSSYPRQSASCDRCSGTGKKPT